MQLIIDILLVAVFGLLVFRGWWRGFMKSVLSLGRVLISFLITLAAGPGVSSWIDSTFVNPPVYRKVFAKLSDIAADVSASAEGSVQALVDKIPASYRGHLDLEAIDPSAKLDPLVESWSVTISNGISGILSKVIGYVLLFALCFLALTLVMFLVDKFAEVGFVRRIDKTLGLISGVISGTLVVMLLTVVIGAILALLGQDEVAEASFMLRIFAGLRGLILG